MEDIVIDIKGIGSPGVSFTEKFNEKFKKYVKFIDEHSDEELDYKELQEKMKENLGITESAIRVDIPFLYNNGFLNEYRKDKIGKIKLKNFVTRLGRAYIEVIELQKNCTENVNQEIVSKIEDILKLIMVLSLIYRKNNGQEENYFKILEFINEFGSIDEKEFYLMLATSDKEELKQKVELYRNNKLNIILENNNTVFEYNKRLLIQAGLIYDKNRRYYLEEKNVELIKGLI